MPQLLWQVGLLKCHLLSTIQYIFSLHLRKHRGPFTKDVRARWGGGGFEKSGQTRT